MLLVPVIKSQIMSESPRHKRGLFYSNLMATLTEITQADIDREHERPSVVDFVKLKNEPQYLDEHGYYRWTKTKTLVHRTRMEWELGRKLSYYGHEDPRNEIVHHIDGNKWNNNIKNLRVMTQDKHHELHCRKWRKERKRFK